MQVVYLVFGANTAYHYEAVFSLLGLLGRGGVPFETTVYTDRPEFYGYVKDYARIEALSDETVRAWRGPAGFLWRPKLAAIADAAGRRPDASLLYLDTDIFLHGDLAATAATLAGGGALMHKTEGPLSRNPTRSGRKAWRELAGKTFGGLAVDAATPMWNAGVAGLPPGRGAELARQALAVCDAMCAADAGDRFKEQFALSLVLAAAGSLTAADGDFTHWYGNKREWRPWIEAYLLDLWARGVPVGDAIRQQAALDFGRLPPVKKHTPKARRRLSAWIERWWPDRGAVRLPSAPRAKATGRDRPLGEPPCTT